MKQSIKLTKLLQIAILLSILAGPTGPSGEAALRAQAVNRNANPDVQFREISAGIEYVQLTRSTSLPTGTTGPVIINALRVDLNSARFEFVHALDEGVGLETVSSLAARYRAVAAVNSGYFKTTGTFRGDSLGTLMLNRTILSEPHFDRAAVGLIESAGKQELVFGHLKFSGQLSTGKATRQIDGLNRQVEANELIIFTPQFHRTTLTDPNGVEVVVRRNHIASVTDLKGSSVIPADGFVISALGTAREWVLRNLRRNGRVALHLSLSAVESNKTLQWVNAGSIVGGGPQLITNGQVAITGVQEKILPAFVSDLHPRTAIAKLDSGKILLLTVDGRQPGISVGMSLTSLASLLLEFGATEAINLDGGGSTTMVVNNKVVNKPSDQTGERPVSDAILLFSKAN